MRKDRTFLPAFGLIVCGFVAAASGVQAQTTPLIGKWRSATKNMACGMVDAIEFTEKLVIMGPGSGPVKYSRDGARYIAATGDGRAFVFEKDGNAFRMISPFECRMVKVVKAKPEMMTEGAVCSGILEAVGMEEAAKRIKKSMSPTDKSLDDPVFEASIKSEKALDALMKEKPITEEQFDKAFNSGKASGAKIATYAELKKRLGECDRTIDELAKLAGID